jgi:uncharacterized membrane protein|tara:strand:+ start:359 stop:658 length:300 start_codon:yes stop_codon:yes gene_type:complete
MPPNYPNASNISSNFVELAQYANSVADGWMGRVWLMVWFIIVFTIFSRTQTPKSAFIVASVLTSFFGILFRVMSLISDGDIIMILIVTLIAIGIGFKQD